MADGTIRTADDVCAIRAEIEIALGMLNRDELDVLREVTRGLVTGRAVYGPLDLDTDRRDMLAEASAEHRDGLVYLASATIQLRRRMARGA